MSKQSTHAVGEGPFEPEDFAYVAKSLRQLKSADLRFALYRVADENLNIILAALDAQSEDLTP